MASAAGTRIALLRSEPRATAHTTGSSRSALTPVTCWAFSARSSPSTPAVLRAATLLIRATSSRTLAISSISASKLPAAIGPLPVSIWPHLTGDLHLPATPGASVQARYVRFTPGKLQLVAFCPGGARDIRIVQTLAAVQQPFPEGDAMTMSTDFDLSLVARRRARPPKRKTRITIYLDDEVLNAFRLHAERTGTGYQTLINAALRMRLGNSEPPLLPAAA